MTCKRLYQAYHIWAEKLGVEPQEEIEGNMVLSRDVLEMGDQRVIEAFHVVGHYIDKLHMFVFSELTTVKRNTNGDSGDVVDREYLVHLIT